MTLLKQFGDNFLGAFVAVFLIGCELVGVVLAAGLAMLLMSWLGVVAGFIVWIMITIVILAAVVTAKDWREQRV
jgi:Mg2+/Co2+ transporter CorB